MRWLCCADGHHFRGKWFEWPAQLCACCQGWHLHPRGRLPRSGIRRVCNACCICQSLCLALWLARGLLWPANTCTPANTCNCTLSAFAVACQCLLTYTHTPAWLKTAAQV